MANALYEKVDTNFRKPMITHIADHERHDGGRDGRTPAREHSRIACGHILDRGNGFEDAAPNTAGMAIRSSRALQPHGYNPSHGRR